MEAALATGMFNFGFSSVNTLSKDVFQTNDSKFEEVFSKKMDEKKGIENKKENNKKDVSEKKDFRKTEDDNKINDETKVKDESKVEKTKSKKRNEDEKVEDVDEEGMAEKINALAESLIKDVKVTDVNSIEDIEKLVEVEDLGLTNEEMLKLQEVLEEKLLQNVIEVGPQNVETEKITLNKYDDMESKLEALEKRLGTSNSKMEKKDIETEDMTSELNANEFSSDFVSSFEEKSGLENENGKDKSDRNDKNDIQHSLKIKDDNKIKVMDVDTVKMDVKITDVKLNSMSETILNRTNDMQDQIDIINQISEKVDVNILEDKSEMIIKLKPDHLGKVTVEIAVESGNVTAKFLAESEKVKEILEANMQDLKDHLAKQGMVVQDLSVSVGNDSRGPLFEQNNYGIFKKRQKIMEVNNEAYSIEDDYGISELETSQYWPDSTVSFSA